MRERERLRARQVAGAAPLSAVPYVFFFSSLRRSFINSAIVFIRIFFHLLQFHQQLFCFLFFFLYIKKYFYGHVFHILVSYCFFFEYIFLAQRQTGYICSGLQSERKISRGSSGLCEPVFCLNLIKSNLFISVFTARYQINSSSRGTLL